MKKLTSRLIIFATITTLMTTLGCANLSNVTVRVRIVDENGRPIKEVRSELMSLSGDDSNSKVGFTDTNGMYSVYLKNIFYEVGGFFNKTGYYQTNGQIWHWDKWGGVPPANTNFVVVMRRIIDPVPMAQKHIETLLPLNDVPVGFDLEVGDWVSPHGKGKVSDFQMTGMVRYESRLNREAQITLNFTEELCGIQSFIAMQSSSDSPLRSELMPPYSAPDGGYEPTILLWRIIDASYYPKTHEIKDRNYLFRTRVETNDEGKIIKANYGWIIGEFFIEAKKDNRIWMQFSYYYNPDQHSRSLEPQEIADRQIK